MRDAIRFTVAFGAALLTDGIIERFGFGGWVLFAAAVLAFIAVDKLLEEKKVPHRGCPRRGRTLPARTGSYLYCNTGGAKNQGETL